MTWYQRNRPLIRAVVAALVGVGLALACPHLPPSAQQPCRVAVRLWRALT